LSWFLVFNFKCSLAVILFLCVFNINFYKFYNDLTLRASLLQLLDILNNFTSFIFKDQIDTLIHFQLLNQQIFYLLNILNGFCLNR